VLGLLLAGIGTLFAHLQALLEMQLVDSGLAVFWWLIVLAYFIADLSMVLVLLLHASCARLDHSIYVQLYAIWLQYSYLVFGVAATLWTAVALLRHHSMKNRLFRQPRILEGGEETGVSAV
jgi:hypothetical protein